MLNRDILINTTGDERRRGRANGSHSRQFVVLSVYQATQLRHLVFQLFHEYTNKHTNNSE